MKAVINKYYPFFPLLLLGVYFIYKATLFPVHDFANYYFGSLFLADGHFNNTIYFPYEFNKAIADIGHLHIFASYAPNTPFLAWFFLPLTLLTVAKAKLAFNLISLCLLLFSLYRLFSFYCIDTKWTLLIPLLFLIPIKNNLLFGQVYFLLFFLLTEGWLAYEKEKWKSMALFWSLAILLKVFPMLLVALLLFRKQWKALMYLAIPCLLFFGISVFCAGIDIWFFYLKTVLPKASNGEIANSIVDNYQSVFMFWKRILVYESTENPHPFYQDSGWFRAAVLAFKIGIVSLGFFVSKRTTNAFVAFSFWILAMILLSPYGSTYTFLLLLFPFLVLAKSEISNLKKGFCCLMLFLICNLPLSVFIEKSFPFSYLRLFFLLVFVIFFAVYLFQRAVLPKAIFITCAIFFFGTFFKRDSSQKSQILLSGESPILIYNYEIKNKQLHYYYWNDNGENQASVSLDSHNLKLLQLRNNQVFYKNKQLTFDSSHKLKPILVDNKAVIYLSDYDRGIGFYTLRKQNIAK
jgi:hypothetical protein